MLSRRIYIAALQAVIVDFDAGVVQHTYPCTPHFIDHRCLVCQMPLDDGQVIRALERRYSKTIDAVNLYCMMKNNINVGLRRYKIDIGHNRRPKQGQYFKSCAGDDDAFLNTYLGSHLLCHLLSSSIISYPTDPLKSLELLGTIII